MIKFPEAADIEEAERILMESPELMELANPEEVQANVAEKRRNLTEKERRVRPLRLDEDVAAIFQTAWLNIHKRR
jgi:hypothetical protein